MQTPHPLVTELAELDTLKTWSVIVTLLGDFQGDQLSGSQLRILLGHLGLKPEAIRVALHRLKSDGWIVSEKQGRVASYALSKKARAETQAVSADVYDSMVKYSDGWTFHVINGTSYPDEAISVSRDVVLVPVQSRAKIAGSLILHSDGADVPDWLEDRLVPRPLIRNAAVIERALAQTGGGSVDGSALDQTAFRLIVLHHWRRLALRLGTWAHIGLCHDGIPARCQHSVTSFLQATPKISV